MLQAIALNGNRSNTMNEHVEKMSHIAIGAVPLATNAGVLLRLSLTKFTAALFPIGEICIIPTSNIGAGNHTNATLLAETAFTFWIAKSRTAQHIVISFLSHIGADATVQALQLAIGVDISIARFSMFAVINVLKVSLANDIAAYNLHHNPQPQAAQAVPLQLPIGFAAAIGAAIGAAGGGAGGAGGGAGLHPGQPNPHHANSQVSAQFDIFVRNRHLFNDPQWLKFFIVGQQQNSASFNTSYIKDRSEALIRNTGNFGLELVGPLCSPSGDSTKLTLTRTELGSKLTKSGIYLINHKKLVRRRCIKTESILVVLCQGEMFIVVGYLGANADLIQS